MTEENNKIQKVQNMTIRDFGNQWLLHGKLREDYWTSDEMFKDYLCNLIDPKIITGSTVLEVGFGSGRILRMIDRYAPNRLIGVEPSIGFNNLISNTLHINNLELLNIKGSDYNIKNINIIFSLGVIHHIKCPENTPRNIYSSLSSDGIFICWVYGMENNRIYVGVRKILSNITRILQDESLDKICNVMQIFIVRYGEFSVRYMRSRLPITKYIQEVFAPCGELERKYILFDQLNPAYAKYYTKRKFIKTLKKAGFTRIELAHRHGYSWTAAAYK